MPPTINRRTALRGFAAGLLSAAAFDSVARVAAGEAAPPASRPSSPWLGVHMSIGSDDGAAALAKQLPALADQGFNALVVEVGYTHAPELLQSVAPQVGFEVLHAAVQQWVPVPDTPQSELVH